MRPTRFTWFRALILLVTGVLGLAVLAAGPGYDGGQYFGIHFVAFSAMATLIGLSAILLGMLAKVAIAIYHPMTSGTGRALAEARSAAGMAGRPGALLTAGGFTADALLAFRWLFVGGPMEQSVHLVFVITTASVAGVVMVLSGFVLKLLLDSLGDPLLIDLAAIAKEAT